MCLIIFPVVQVKSFPKDEVETVEFPQMSAGIAEKYWASEYMDSITVDKQTLLNLKGKFIDQFCPL